MAELRDCLDENYDVQAKEAYFWFHARETLNSLDSNGKLERYPGEVTKGEIEDNEGETDSDVDGNIMTPSSSSDGGDEYSDSTTTDKIEAAEVAKETVAGEEAAAAEKDSPKESAKNGEMKEDTQFGAKAVDGKNESFVGEAKDAVSREPSFEAGRTEVDEDAPDDPGLQCKQCGQTSPKQQAPDAHTAEAHPSEALKADILKLFDDRFNALFEEQRGDARKEIDRLVEAQTEASALLKETTEAREVILRETTEARNELSHATAESRDAILRETTSARTKVLQEASKARASVSRMTDEWRSEGSRRELLAQHDHDDRMLRSQEDHDRGMLRSKENHNPPLLRSKQHNDRRLEEVLQSEKDLQIYLKKRVEEMTQHEKHVQKIGEKRVVEAHQRLRQRMLERADNREA
jgi:hypothetical protein